EGVVNQPWRVILDPRGRLTGKEAVFGAGGQTLHVVAGATPAKTDQLIVPYLDARLDLTVMLDELFRRGAIGLLVEGGAFTTGTFFDADLVDALEIYVAPKLFGEGKSWLVGTAPAAVDGALRLKFTGANELGEDLRLSYRRLEL
ncbi:MAG TPA: dihydrofolate reductase family protein, partial [Fimbriimonadaceae bacterium]|nr:dihydrofolate reductase family protein [Fimbriimonadaceae bacterium]